MKRIISFGAAAKICLILFIMLCVFHISILAGILFFDYVPLAYLWGGKLTTEQELLNFEVVSLFTALLCVVVVVFRAQYVVMPKLIGFSRVACAVLSVLFFLNTLGNILANSVFEKWMGVLTFIITLLCLRLAMRDGEKTYK